MPFDPHTYLVSRGWKGKGSALKDGGLERPITQAQRKDLKGGLGKNRDDGFEFWDHVYAVAANTIQIKVGTSDDESSDNVRVVMKEEKNKLHITKTGILSNRRPARTSMLQAPIPSLSAVGEYPTGESEPRDLLALAKKEAAKRELYSRFHRGGVIHDPDVESMTALETKEEGQILSEDEERRRRREEKRRRKAERKKLEEEEAATTTNVGPNESGVESTKRKRRKIDASIEPRHSGGS